jgi:hypothetical protein
VADGTDAHTGAAPGSIASLLASYYAQSYRRLLGVDLAERDLIAALEAIACAFRGSAAPEALEIPSVPGMHELRRRAHRHRCSVAPIQRLRAFRGVEGRLGMLRDADLRLAEVGSDDGVLLDLIFGQGRKRLLVGIDPVVKTTRSWARDHGRAHLVRTLEEAHAITQHVGMAWSSFTLHHVQAGLLTKLLNQLADLLWPGGLLFVLEDDPGAPDGTPTPFDRQSAQLSPGERQLMLSVNDYWANVVVYGRGHDDQVHGFRDAPGWIQLLHRCGFSGERYQRLGFNLRRLHGVPSCAILVRVCDRP